MKKGFPGCSKVEKTGAGYNKSPGREISPGLASEVIRFAHCLKIRGFKIFQGSVQDSLKGLRLIDLSERNDFFAVLRANLVTNDMEWSKFRQFFNEFWRHLEIPDKNKTEKENRAGEEPPLMPCEQIGHTDQVAQRGSECRMERDREWLEGTAYSPISEVEKKDLADFDRSDIQLARLALKKISEPFRIQISRRFKKAKQRGRIDLSRTMKSALGTGGIPLELFFRAKKKRLRRLIIIADVSGSMDRYARFVMPFLLGLKGVGSRAEAFVFSTSLTPITHFVQHLPVKEALKRISCEASDWSGGTRIGFSLRQFNREHGRKLQMKRSVVVILSDGWDLGGRIMLKREMELLKKSANRVIWLNPLLGNPDFQPMCKGMQTAMPFCDYLIPADSLDSLKRAGRILAGAMIP